MNREEIQNCATFEDFINGSPHRKDGIFSSEREGKRNEGRGEEKMAFKIVTPLDSRSNIHRRRSVVVPI